MKRFCYSLVALIAVAVCGCSQDSEGPSSEKPKEPGAEKSEELTVLCGSSFRSPMEKLIDMYDKETGEKIVMVFGGSEDHLPKVKTKAFGDLYVTHDPYMQYTKDADALLEAVQVGFLAPVLVVPKGNPKNIKSIEDLGREGVKVVITSPEFSTCGEMIIKLLEDKGIKDAVMKNVGNAQVKHHAMVGNHLQTGSRDAGIMWNGVAHNFKDDVDVVQIPYEYDEQIHVWVMGLSYSDKQERVKKFLEFVKRHGPEVFAEYGYTK